MLLAGSSTIDITPPVGYPLAGFAARKDVSQEVHDPLLAKTLVVESGATAAIVTADLVSFPNRMVGEIREKAGRLTRHSRLQAEMERKTCFMVNPPCEI